MKKLLIIISIVLMLLLTSACKEKEQSFVEKYFSALKQDDSTTLSAMAITPVKIQFSEFKVEKLGEPKEEEMTLPGLNIELVKLEQKLSEKQENARLKNEKFRDAKDYVEDKEIAKEDAEDGVLPKEYLSDLQGYYDKTEKELKKASREYKSTKYRVRKQKAKIEYEKKLMTLSTSIKKDIESYKGKSFTREVVVDVTLMDGSLKKYAFVLRKYLVYKDDASKKKKKEIKYKKSRFVILEIKPV